MSFSLDKKLWIAIDIETTGLNPWKYEILEIGAVKFSAKDIISRFQVLIKPLKKQDPTSRKIHNITDKEINENGIPMKEALDKCLAFMEDTPLVFHNASFDISFLTIAFPQNSIPIPGNDYYDTLYLSKKYFPERSSHSLANLKEILKIDTGRGHRALSDAEATANVFLHIIEHFKDIITSNKKYQKFMRFHRRLDEFQIRIPKNLERIENYFNRYIQSGSMMRIKYKSKNGIKNDKIVKILQVMIFNQNIYLRSNCLDQEDELMIPLETAVFHDPDKGMLNYKQV